MKAIEDNKGQVLILGIGESTPELKITKNEPLSNLYHMQDNGVVVEDKSRKFCGKQYLTILNSVRSTIIYLVFYGYIFKTNPLKPTEE